MMTINKQDILKTLVIIWFVAATGYVVYDQYAGYKIRGMQQAYQTGYAKSVEDLIAQTEKSGCQPFEVKKDDKKISLVDGQCLQQQSQGQAQGPQASVLQPASKK